MKMKLPALVLGFATCAFVTLAQDANNNTPPPAAPPPAAPEVPVAAPADSNIAISEAGTNEVVPLIVIDEVPLTDAIRNLARQSNLNFQFDPRITSSNQPNVSIRFENVTAQEALQAVLENHGLQLTKDPKSKIGRVTIKDPQAPEPLFSKIIQLKYSSPTNMISIVKPTLSQNSSVVADTRTSQLIITTTEKEMDGVTALVESLDLPTKQVLIEARLLETAKNPSSIRGIDWSGTFEAQNFAFGNNVGANATLPGNKGTPRLLVDTAKGFNPATAFLDADGVSAVLSFLNKDSDTEVVATPRAVTLDNTPATLSVTRAFPIFQVTPGAANVPAGAQITYTNLGTILEVTPRIAADNNIELKVVPEVSNIDSVDTQTLNGQANTANIYAIRRMETQVRIPSGNTLVMGGLINDTVSKNFTKVPLLGDLPGVGALFRSESKKRNKSNLIVFITPTIVEDEDFHLTTSGVEFLQTRYVPRPEQELKSIDSAHPHDWTKPVY